MPASAIDYGDVQGLVRFGHGPLQEAAFLLLEVADPAAARAWLAAAPVTSAVKGETPAAALQVAFTREGLEALGVPRAVIEGFSLEFIAGMTGEASRSRRLGDVGENAPSGWRWGGPGKVPHVLALLYAREGGLDAWQRQVKGGAWASTFREVDVLPSTVVDYFEPFGFRDGVSQPALDWDRRRQLGREELEYGNLVALGEFLLGYPNEYGKYTDRPLLDTGDAAAAGLPEAEDVPGKRDLGRNGTYLVFRQLRQDVKGFWRFLDQQSGSAPQAARKLAEAMLGRTMLGEPLVPPSGPLPGVGPDAEDVQLNQFTYATDADGVRCPFGAHARRANPRNTDLPGGPAGLLARLIRTLGFGNPGLRDDLMASTRFHRLLRRGRDYGKPVPPEAFRDPSYPDDEETGLHFIGLNANLSRQFEFVQGAWMTSTKFDGLTEESDPLLGNRQPVRGCPYTDTFSQPRESRVRSRVSGLPQFVTVRGGAYFFLPGLRALRYIASGAGGER